MLILEDIRSYQEQVSTWLSVLKGLSDSDGCVSVPLLELLDLGRQLPGKIVGAAFDQQLRQAYDKKDMESWCNIIAGRSEKLPTRLLRAPGEDFWEKQQVRSIMSFILEILRRQDQVPQFIGMMKELAKHTASVKMIEFRQELDILCDAAGIDEAHEDQVKTIHEKFLTLLGPACEGKTASMFQKALQFFPSGLSFCSRVEAEVRVVNEMAGADMDLKAVEKTLEAWPEVVAIENTGAQSSEQVSIAILRANPDECARIMEVASLRGGWLFERWERRLAL